MSEPLDGTATTQAERVYGRLRRRRPGDPDRIAVSGSTVMLDLASAAGQLGGRDRPLLAAVISGERMRDNASPTKNETANFGPSAVVNNTPDTIAPSVVSASVNATTITSSSPRPSPARHPIRPRSPSPPAARPARSRVSR